MALPLNIPFRYMRPFFHAMDAEQAHSVTIKALKSGLGPQYSSIDDPALKTKIWGREFSNPVGLAAGFDKNAEVIHPMLNIGFGFVETGGVTTVPQKGLPKPRIFRDVKNEAIINKMNFPNVGMEQFKKNVEAFRKKYPGKNNIVGIQIAKSADQNNPEEDFLILLKELGGLADYIVVNISCPNTPGLRDLEEAAVFEELITKIAEEKEKIGLNNTPLIVKFSPDLDDEKASSLAAACLKVKVDGIIVSNTTTTRPEYLPDQFRERQGGLSGKPLRDKSTALIKKFYQLTNGHIPIIGLGGISSGQDAYDKICAGASLIQLYSALVFKGPEVVSQINRELLELLQKDGHENIQAAVGTKT